MDNGGAEVEKTAVCAQLQSLLTSVGDVVWLMNAECSRVLFVNDSFQEVYGRSTADFMDNPGLWRDAVHPNDEEIITGSLQALETAGEVTVEYRIVRPDGEIRWVSEHKTRIITEQNGVTTIGGVARDVTARKHTEQLLQLQQLILHAIAMREHVTQNLLRICQQVELLVPDAVATILVLDEQRKLRVAAAPSCSAELAAALDGLVPGNNAGSCGAAAYTALPAIVVDTMQDERWQTLREVARDYQIGACWSLPILSSNGEVLGTFAISSHRPQCPAPQHDRMLEVAAQLASITLQHDYDRTDLLAAKDSAEAAAQIKGELLANVSHELRTPMTAILGFSDILLAESGSDDLQREKLELIRNNGEHLLGLINNLLDISKIEAGHMEPEHLACSPREIVNDTVELFVGAMREKGLRFELHGIDALPSPVLTDPMRFRQILVNLLSNAIKFTESGSITLTCRATEIDNNRVRLDLSFADTGIGLKPEQIERLFAHFQQAEASTTRRFGGTGLGLSLSRQLAKLLGGDIHVASEYGCGSTFTVTIVADSLANFAKEQAPDAISVTESSGQVPAFPAGGTLQCRVLVAEDAPAIQRLIEFILAYAGAEVTIVENGQEACRAVSEATTPFDMILMDMQMPVLDGYSATRTLRQEGYQQPIVALTAHAQSGDEEKCLAAGCSAYMSKPIRAHELVELVVAQTTSAY